jgi:hypothetical protein
MLESWSVMLVVVPVFLMVPILLVAGEAHWGPFELREDFLIAIGLMPGLAAAINSYAERLALNAQARQYDRMRVLFERAYQLLPETVGEANAALAQAVYRELGIEAMRENAEWVAVYRQRPLQVLQ